MFESLNRAGKRVMAMLLVFAMMFALLGEYVPSWFTAFAMERSGSRGSSISESRSSRSSGRSSRSRSSSGSGIGSSRSRSSSRLDGGALRGDRVYRTRLDSWRDRGTLFPSVSPSDDPGVVSPDGGSEAVAPAGDASAGLTEDAGPEAAQDGAAVEQVEGTSEDENTSGAPVVSGADEAEAAGDAGETVQEPEEKEPVPAEADPVAETEEEQTGVGGEAAAPSEAVSPENEGEAEAEASGDVLTLTTALSPAVENSVPAEDEAEVENGSPLFATQAFTAPVMLAQAGAEAEKVCVLQQKIDDAMASVTGKLSGRIRVLLEKNTAYDGVVSIDRGDREVADDFELEVSSVDAGSDGLQADGTTLFTGDMTIRGISVRIAGVGLPGTVTVEGAKSKLDYYGTRADDGANVTVTGEGAEAALHMGEGADTVSAEVQGGRLSVDAGAGADAVTAEVVGGGSASIATGEGEDNVNVSVIGAGSAAGIDTGAGADTVDAQARQGGQMDIDTGSDGDLLRARVTDGGGAQIDSGAGDDRVEARVSIDSAATVDTGAGDDMIDVIGLGGRDDGAGTFARVNAGAGSDTVTLAGQGAEGAYKNDRAIAVDLGSGVNRLDVDLSIADLAANVAVIGGAEHDRLHLTGTLDDRTAEDQRVTGTAQALELAGLRNRLSIASEGVEVITDNLSNKRTVEFEETVEGPLRVELPFTNYIYRGPTDGNVAFQRADGALLMTNVILAPDDQGAIHVGEDAVIRAEGLQLVLAGREVQVDGTLKAGLVRIEAVDGTDRDALLRVNAGKIPLTDIELSADLSLELLNITDVAKVAIGQNARVFSAGDIIIGAAVDQAGGIINIGDLSKFNLVDLKVAKATVDVQGKLYAGYDPDDETPTDARGSVSILTSARTYSGFDENGAPVTGLPLAITLANMDSIIDIASIAEIHATDSIRYTSNADMRLAVRSDSMKSLPVAIAAAYATVDSRATVAGKLEAGGDVTGTAVGNVEVTTIADRGEQKSISGGYVGLAVVIQNVRSELDDAARVTAGRDVNVRSVAREKVDTQATTGTVDQNEGATAEETEGDLYKEAYEMLMEGWYKIKGFFTGEDEAANAAEKEAAEEAAAKLDAAIGKVAVSGHGIAVDESAKTGGDFEIATSNDGNEVTNTVTVTPRAGYRVKSITWRGLNPGDTQYTGETVTFDVPDDSPRSLSFVQSTKNVTVFVEYEEYAVEEPEADESEDESEDEADPEDSQNAFEDVRANDSIVVDDLLDRVTAAATDDYADRAGESVDAASRTVALTLPVVREHDAVLGAVLTYDTEADGASLRTVAPGQALRLVVNPGEGRLLKQGSLKVSYQHGGVSEIRVVTADDHGRYLIDIPEDVDVSAGVQVSAEFVEDTWKDEAEPQRGTQIAGAVAITVTENYNEAVIDAGTEEGAGAQVSAGRDVNVTADSAADIRNVADGTAVTQNVVTGTQPDEDAPVDPMAGIIPVSAAKIEKLNLTPDRQMASPGDLVKVTVDYNKKEHIKAGTLKAVLTSADGTYREEIYMARQSDFTYTFRMPDALPGDLDASNLSVSFVGEVAEGATGAGVTTSLGASAAITVSSSHNRADLKGAVDAARDVRVTADGEGAAHTETRAGYSEGNTGIGGAVSVQVAAMDSRARMFKSAAVQLDGDLALSAENNVEFYVDADGSGSKRTAKGMGIGAGLAVAFDSAHALAAIEDGAALTGRTDAAIGGLDLNARQRVDDQVSAAAGAGSTGTSLMAAVALDFVTTSAKARLGDIRGDALTLREGAAITADNAARHNIMTEGTVAGQGTAIGAALGLTMVKDRAVATLGESLSAGDRVKISAVNESAVRNVNVASASGGRTPFRLKLGDDLLYKLINGVVWLASVDDTLPKDIANIWLKYHIPGIMTSSSMGVAGAAGANIQTSVARAEILDDIAVTTAGKLSVTAQNRTEAQVKGDASTTESGTGIGVGAGLNLVKMDNIAFVGNGRIDAAALAVTATTKRREMSFDGGSFGAVSGAQAEEMLTDRVGEAVDLYVNDLIREVGLDSLPDSIMDGIIDPLIDSVTNEILGVAGLGEMFTEGFVDEVVDLVKDNIEIIKWTGIGLLALGLETDILNVDSLVGAENAQDVVDDFVDDFNTMLIVSVRDGVLKTLVHGNIGNILSGKLITKDVLGDIKDYIKDNLKPTLKDLDKGFMKDLGLACGVELTDDQLDDLMEEFDHGNTKLADVNYVNVAKTLFGIDDKGSQKKMFLMATPETEEDRETIRNLDELVDEYGDQTADAVLGGFDAVLQNAGSETSLQDGRIGDLVEETLTFDVDGERCTLAEAIIRRAEAQNVMLTDDQKAVLQNPYDLLAEADRASAGEHLIDTQSISGAGAAGTSMSGSAAVTKLDFNTRAQVGYEKLIYANPEEFRDEYTLDIKKYIDKVDKPEDDIDEYYWKEYTAALPEALQTFVERQQDKYAQYEADLAAYNKDKKNKKKPDKDDYKLEEDDFKACTKDLGNVYAYTKQDWYDEYQEDLYDKIMDYVKDQEKKDKAFTKDKKRYEESLKTNAEKIGEQVSVAGDVAVVADSQRLVNNVASASLNGKGSASANGSAAEAANSDVGDSSAATHVTQNRDGSVRMTTDVGATSTLDDENADRPRIYINVDPGFELEADEDDGKCYAGYSFNAEEEGNDSGIEAEGKVEIKTDAGGRLYIDTADIPEVPEEKDLYLTLGTKEVLRNVAIAAPIAEGVDVEAGAVSAEVKGRGLDDGDQLAARAGDTVVVTIQKENGRRPEYLGYSYKDANGKLHSVEINPETITGRDLGSYAFAAVTQSKDEIILSFRMPDADADGVTIVSKFIRYDEQPDWMPNYSMKAIRTSGTVSGFGRGMGLGASMAMVMGDDKTTALIGHRQKGENGAEDGEMSGLTAGTVTVMANSEHSEALSSVSGTDPLSGKSTADTISKTSLDASAAVDLLDTGVSAVLDEANRSAVTGYSREGVASEGDVTVAASEDSETSLSASAFSAGRGTAVGATLALNMATYGAKAELGTVDATGKVTISADNRSQDQTTAVATAVGADVIRILRAAGVDCDEDDAPEKAENVLEGYDNGEADDSEGTNRDINDRLNANAERNREEDDADEGEEVSGNMSLSSNVLRSQGVSTDVPEKQKSDLETTIDGVNLLAQIGLTGGAGYMHVKNFIKGSKNQIAASVAVSQAEHTANVNVGGDVHAGGDISATTDNTADFAALGTAASMSVLLKATSVSGGVAVIDNKNESNVNIRGDLVSEGKGDITLRSTLTQNMGEDYIDRLAAQSVSGSVAGYDSSASIGAALSVVKSKARTSVNIGRDKHFGTHDLSIVGGDIDIQAVDKSRLAARAGGVSVSLGSSFGMGVGGSTIKSNNAVSATIGDNTLVTGASFNLNAEKQEITEKDYKNLLEMRNSDDALVKYRQKDDEGREFSANVNLSASKLMKLYDGVNKYSFQNNYAEAIGASAELTPGKASVGGSFAVVLTKNRIDALLGDHVTLNIGGDAAVKATDRATNRMVSGGLSIAPSSASVGAAVTVLLNEDTANAKVGQYSAVNADGNITQAAEVGGKAQAFTAGMAMAVSVPRDKKEEEGKDKKDKEGKKADTDKKVDTDKKDKPEKVGSSLAMAGAVNYIANKAIATTSTAAMAQLNGAGDTTMTSLADGDMMALAANSSISVGYKGSAVGASANIITDKAGAYTEVGAGNEISGRNTEIGSDATSQLITGVGSQSAQATGDGKALAAAFNVNHAAAVAETSFEDADGATTRVTAGEGDANIRANADAWALTAAASLPGGVNTALGGSVNVNFFDRKANIIAPNRLKVSAENGNARIQASGKDTAYMLGALLMGSVKGYAVGGNFSYMEEDNDIRVDLGKDAAVTAGGSALIETRFKDFTAAAVGTVALANMNPAVGLSGLYVTKDNQVQTLLSNAEVTAYGFNDSIKNLAGEDVNGVYVGANAEETQYAGVAGVALSAGLNFAAQTVILVNKNRVIADASEAVLSSLKTNTEYELDMDKRMRIVSNYGRGTVLEEGTVRRIYEKYGMEKLEAQFTFSNYHVEVLVDGKWVRANDIRDISIPFESYEGGGIGVVAKDETEQKVIAGGLGFSLGTAVGASVTTLVSDKTVKALAHDMAAKKDIHVAADNNDDITQLALSGGVGIGVGVEIGAAVEVLKSRANAHVGSNVRSTDGGFSLTSGNTADINNTAAVLAVSAGYSASPVGVVTYFQGESTAVLGEGSAVQAAKDVTIEADGGKTIRQHTVGAAFSGKLGISGAVNLQIVKDRTIARAEKDVDIAITDGSLNIGARGDYALRAASAAVGGSKAAVAINAVVTLLRSQTLAELQGNAKASKAVNIHAASKRDVIDGAAALAGGQVGVGVTVLTLVAGAKMDQDAANMLASGNSSEKDPETTFDAKQFMKNIKNNGASKHYDDVLTEDSLAKDLEGNGHRTSELKVGHKEGKTTTFDGSSGYRSDDFDNGSYKDDKTAQGRGENHGLDKNGKAVDMDTQDVKDAKNLNEYDYDSEYQDEDATKGMTQEEKEAWEAARAEELKDAVSARIAATASVSQGNVDIDAEDRTAVDLLGVTLAGGQVGVGVSSAIAVLHSNVIAENLGSLDTNGGSISINAHSVAGDHDKDATAQQRDSAARTATKDEVDDVSGAAIRVIGAAVGAGQVGVAVSAAVALTDNVTRAILGGSVQNSGAVSLNAEHKYGKVLAATGAVGAGQVGAAASVAVAQARGEVSAVIARNTSVRTVGDRDVGEHDVSLTTTSDVDARAIAVTAGAGMVGINAGVAVAKNALQQNTMIGAGANVFANRDLNLKANVNARGNTWLLGIAGGLVAASLNAGVADLKVKVNTSIGESLPEADGSLPAFTEVQARRSINVANDVTTQVKPLLASLSGGDVACSGNALLAFNRTDSVAKIDNASAVTNRGDISVLADMKSQVDASMANLNLALTAAVGLSVNYADLQSVNHAAISNSLIDSERDLNIRAGSGENHSSSVSADTLAGNLGPVTVGLNAGIARNRAYNFATLVSDRDEETRVYGDLNMSVDNTSEAHAGLLGMNFSIGNVAASTVVAMNDASSRVNADLKRLNVKGDVNLTTNQSGNTDAGIVTGGGALLSADASVALAYGRTNALIDFAVRRSSTMRNLNARNNASDITTSDIKNAAFKAIAAQVMYGAAYSKDIFNIDVKLTGDVDEDHKVIKGEHTVKGDVTAQTDYKVKSRAVVEPSAGGMLDVSLVKLAANMANARNTAFAGSNFEASKGATDIYGDVTVNTRGAADTYSEITSAKFTIAPINVGASIARSDLSMVQAATLRSGGNVTIGGKIDVQSVVKKLTDEERIAQERQELKNHKFNSLVYNLFKETLYKYRRDDGSTAYFNSKTNVDSLSNAEVDQIYANLGSGHFEGRSARATALVGTSGGDPDEKNEKGEKIKITLIDTALNQAIANENMTSTAAVLGGAVTTETKMVQVDNGEYVTKTRTYDDLDVVDHYKFKHLATGVVFDPTAETITYKDDPGKVHGGVKEGDKNYVDEGKHILYWNLYQQYKKTMDQQKAWEKASKDMSQFKKYDDPKKFERIPVYAKYTEEYEEWVPKLEDVLSDVDVYDLANNHLKARGMNIYTGVEGNEETAALARSDGAKTIGFATAGNLNARSEATDSFSVLFEGMTADIDGSANLEVRTQTRSNALGYAPGSLTVLDVDTASDARASVGTGNDQQTVGIVIGEGATLNADYINLSAANNGTAKADLIKGNSWSLGTIKSSSVPTNSWYTNVISIGRDATLNGAQEVAIRSASNAKAESVVVSNDKGLLLNYNKMMGKNYVKQINDVDFGDGSKIYSYGNIDIDASTNTRAKAETSLKGGGIFAGNTAKAQNDVERTARVNFGRNVEVKNDHGMDLGGALNVVARTGDGEDSITANSYVGAKGVVAIGNARAYNNVDQWAEIIVAEGTSFNIWNNLNMLARSTSYLTAPALIYSENLRGIGATATVDSVAGVPLPNGVAKNTVKANAYIDINQPSETNPGDARVKLLAGKDLNLDATNRSMTLYADSKTTGKGLAGVSNSTARNDATLTNAVWIDNATLKPEGKLTIWAESGGRTSTGKNRDKTHIISNAYAKLNGIGKAVTEANITGTMINQIRTNDENNVDLEGKSQTHLTNAPETAIWQEVEAESKIKKILGIPLGKKKEKEVLKWYVWNRCDFCHVGKEHDLTHSEQNTIESRYKEAFDRAMLPIDTVANEVAGLRKTLSALQNINRTAVSSVNVTRDGFGIEENRSVGQRFALAMQTLLDRDVTFDGEQLRGYQLWTNTATRLDTYLLPNATRLYANTTASGMGLQYLAEVFQYDLLNDGRELGFDIITALTEYAFRHPTVPMGDIGALDFATGTLMLPAQSEHELYLHEVSARWMLDRLNEGFLQALLADSDAANGFALTGGKLPGGAVVSGAVYGGEQEGWQLYWLGETPETVKDPDQTLIFLMVNEQTDEVDAFRTSVNRLTSGQQPVDVSVCLYRDASADMREEERYDLLFYDTPAGAPSLVRLVTDLLDGSNLEIPKPLRIVLRAFKVNGAALSAYSLNDHFYVLLDGSRGGASLANLYRNTFDGDTFESDYLRVEGIAGGNVSVTLKKDQPVWPELSGKNDAQDLNGAKYTRVGEVWYPAEEAPKPTAMPEGMRAA